MRVKCPLNLYIPEEYMLTQFAIHVKWTQFAESPVCHMLFYIKHMLFYKCNMLFLEYKFGGY